MSETSSRYNNSDSKARRRNDQDNSIKSSVLENKKKQTKKKSISKYLDDQGLKDGTYEAYMLARTQDMNQKGFQPEQTLKEFVKQEKAKYDSQQDSDQNAVYRNTYSFNSKGLNSLKKHEQILNTMLNNKNDNKDIQAPRRSTRALQGVNQNNYMENINDQNYFQMLATKNYYYDQQRLKTHYKVIPQTELAFKVPPKIQNSQINVLRKYDELLKIKQQSAQYKQEMAQMYDLSKQMTILKTIKACTKEIDQHSGYLQRYSYKEVRKFIKVSHQNHLIATRKITQDIRWRQRVFPMRQSRLYNILKIGTACMQGCDRNKSPLLILQLNSRDRDQWNVDITNQDYLDYVIYCLEYIVPVLEAQFRLDEQICMLVDLNKDDFNLKLFEQIEDLMQNHYPGRLRKLYIVQINLQKIDEHVKSLFSSSFYKENAALMDDNFKTNLLEFFDPCFTPKQYGGLIEYNFNKKNNLQIVGNVDQFILSEYQSILQPQINSRENPLVHINQ